MEPNVTGTAEERARAHGVSRSTAHRLEYILRVAEAPDGAVPDVARRAARDVLTILASGSGRVSVRDHYESLRMFIERHVTRGWNCAQCGDQMTDRDHRPDARYCSSACRQKAYRARRRDNQPLPLLEMIP